VVGDLGNDTLPCDVLLTSSSSSLLSSLLSSTTLIFSLTIFLSTWLQMKKGGGSKRGFLHILSSSLVRDLREINTYNRARPFTIAK
jgi:hypothetical protein